MSEPAIRVDQVQKVHGEVRALDGVSLTVERGEWVALMGPSGSGKTTLLNLLDGLDRPSAGRVVVFEHEVSALRPDEAAVYRRENVGLIFQQFHMIPYLTAVENVMLGQYFHSMADRAEAMRALDSVGLADRARHLPSQLSGGEQQRVCIARALINDPKLVLADEPTGNLDEDNEAKVLDTFARLHREGKTLVIATHARTLAQLAARTVVLRHGRVVEDRANSAAAPTKHETPPSR